MEVEEEGAQGGTAAVGFSMLQGVAEELYSTVVMRAILSRTVGLREPAAAVAAAKVVPAMGLAPEAVAAARMVDLWMAAAI